MYPLWFTVYSAHDQSSYTLPATGTVMCKDNRTSCRDDFPCDFLVIICEQMIGCSQHDVSFNFLGCCVLDSCCIIMRGGSTRYSKWVVLGWYKDTISNLEHIYQRDQERFGNGVSTTRAPRRQEPPGAFFGSTFPYHTEDCLPVQWKNP